MVRWEWLKSWHQWYESRGGDGDVESQNSHQTKRGNLFGSCLTLVPSLTSVNLTHFMMKKVEGSDLVCYHKKFLPSWEFSCFWSKFFRLITTFKLMVLILSTNTRHRSIDGEKYKNRNGFGFKIKVEAPSNFVYSWESLRNDQFDYLFTFLLCCTIQWVLRLLSTIICLKYLD